MAPRLTITVYDGTRDSAPLRSLLREHREAFVVNPTVVPRCRSRSGVWRREHDLDRDGACVFCDRVPNQRRSRR